MLDRVRELWAERPALLAVAGIAPVVFAVTLLVLFLVVGGADADQAEQQVAAEQQDQSELQDDQAGDADAQQDVTSQPEVTVIVEGGEPDSQQDEPSQTEAPAADEDEEQAEAPSQSETEPEEEPQETVPTEVAGYVVVSLSSLLEDGIDEDALRHGSDGSEGAILPLGNGVVPSSGEPHETKWEIIVPSAGLKSAVVSLGRTPTGAMGSPDNPYVVGWLDSTPAPGEVGNTLLAGHRDYEDVSGNIGTGVCWELNNTRVGDHMLIWDEELNVYYVYTVTEKVTLDPTDRESARYLHNTDVAVVTLITCTGSFNTETHKYSHRLVVVGELSAVASPDA
ncbi:MAG: sortase [Chloroflexi bacterium]|nr:sortase [Chloroflexota bacterium]MYF81469.1 sortase [Chloroflexota bacterium]MYI03724.1 sortase [Chloroflexota bacterium]